MEESDYTATYENDPDYEDRTVLVIRFKGEEIARRYDGGEPEDNSFCRDWHWIAGELKRAYELGISTGISRISSHKE